MLVMGLINWTARMINKNNMITLHYIVLSNTSLLNQAQVTPREYICILLDVLVMLYWIMAAIWGVGKNSLQVRFD